MMMIYKIHDICDLIAGFAFKSKDFGNYSDKVIKIADIQPPIVNMEYTVGVDTRQYDINKLQKFIVAKGDYVLAMTGATIGKLGRITSDCKAYINQRVLTFRPNEQIVNKDYLYYSLCSNNFTKYILNHIDSETAQPNISAGSVGGFEISLPSLGEQRRIVDILIAIDRKIEINKRINDNLEQQAQAAFNNIIAQYSECETINLSEIAVLNPKRAIAKGTLARSIEMAQLPTSGSFPAGWDMKEYNGGMKFQNGDTLMARITPCLENGKVAYINFLEENEVAFGSTEYIVIASKGAIAPEVFYFLTRHNDFVDFAVKNMNGSSGRQRVSAETIGTYKLPIISPEDMFILETIAKEALKKIKYNSLENIRLSEIRDTLLPKLMSGELKINSLDC